MELNRQLPSSTHIAPGHLQGILERLRTRSGLTVERLQTRDLEVASLLNLPAVRREKELGMPTEGAILSAVRLAAGEIVVNHRVVADAVLALRLVPKGAVSANAWTEIYADDLGDRRKALVEHWDELFGVWQASEPPPCPTVRQLRAVLESAALAEVAATLAQMSSPEPEPDGSGVRSLINTLLRCSENLHDLSSQHPACQRLLADRLTTLCREMGLALRDLSAGEITVNPDGEIMFAIDCLALASKSLKAVSYEEDEFWTQPQGERYFQEQKALLAKDGFEIRRLFVVKSDASPDLKEAYRKVIEEQLTARISVGVIQLPATERLASKLEDFVVYDESYVRYAHADAMNDDRGLAKTATLSLDRQLAERYLELFRSLETAAIDGRRYLDMDKT
jgi:hypothetical protein